LALSDAVRYVFGLVLEGFCRGDSAQRPFSGM
jgi:hypothetical protein